MMRSFISNTFCLYLLLSVAILECGCHQKSDPAAGKKQATMVVKPKQESKKDTLIFKDPKLAAFVKETDKLLSIFDTISPMHEGYDIRKFGLNKSEMHQLREQGDSTLMPYVADGFEITANLSGMIENNLQRILEWKGIDDYDLSLLFDKVIGTTASPDKRLYCFSFDEETGGSYHSRISLMHYIPGNGKNSQTWPLETDSVFNKDGYGSIDTINTKKGLKYILQGEVIGCNTCLGSYVDVVQYENGRFTSDFNYSVSTRTNYDMDGAYDNPIIAYNAKLHTINIDYLTSDETPDCNCDKYSGMSQDSGAGLVQTGDIANVTCMYKFNGRDFVLKKRKAKKLNVKWGQ